MKQLRAIADDPEGWQVTIDSKKDRMKCEQRTSERGFNVGRITSIQDFDSITSFRAFGNGENRLKYDKNCERIESIEWCGANFLYGYQKLHKILSVASRDLYQMSFWEVMDDNSVYCVIWGEDEDMPEEPGCVRMTVPIGGAIFKPLKDDKTKCEMTYIAEAHLGGNVPGWITK